MKHYIKYFSILPSICIMIFIFLFSHQPAAISSSESSYFAEKIINFAQKTGSFTLSYEEYKLYLNKIHTLIRKLAHIIEYAALSISVLLPFFIFGKKSFSYILYTIFICFFYAAADEFHQLFVPGRSGQIRDVLIDSIGIGIGIIFFYLCLFLKKHFTKVTI